MMISTATFSTGRSSTAIVAALRRVEDNIIHRPDSPLPAACPLESDKSLEVGWRWLIDVPISRTHGFMAPPVCVKGWIL